MAVVKLLLVLDGCDARRARELLASVPGSLRERCDVRGLVVVQAPQPEVHAGEGSGNDRLEVLASPDRLGYGQRRKIALRFALDQGFDVVAVLGGDDPRALEALPGLVRPLLEGEARAVLAARTRGRWLGCLPGGLLTAIQNRILGTDLADLHAALRAYSVPHLGRIPFELNADGSQFDTEIVVQLVRAGLRVTTHPTAVVCRVGSDGPLGAYAYQVLRTTLSSRLHDAGIFYRPNYELRRPEEVYSLKLGYPSSHTLAVAAVPAGSRVLDVGCGRGALAAELHRKGCWVHGVDRGDGGAVEGVDRFDQVDLDVGPLPIATGGYDVVLLLDIVEHLEKPERLLAELRERLGACRTRVLISVPNVGFLPLRLRLLLGGFEYGREGILDLTHRRLFTLRSLRRMLRLAAYDVAWIRGVPGPYPKALGDIRLARLLLALNRAAIRVRCGLFAYQLFVEARPRPTVGDLLRSTCDTRTARSAAVEHR